MSREIPSFDSVVIAEDDLIDGYSAQDIFESHGDSQGITFDDLIALPGSIGRNKCKKLTVFLLMHDFHRVWSARRGSLNENHS